MTAQQFFLIIRRRYLSILMVVLGAAVFSSVLASRIPNQYIATARVVLDVPEFSGSGRQSEPGDQVDNYITTQGYLLKEAIVTNRVVKALGWADNADLRAIWLAQTGGKGNIVSWLSARLAQNVSAVRVPGGTVLEIRYIAPDTESATAIVRAFRDAYLDAEIAVRRQAAQQSALWSEKEAEKARLRLADTIAQRTRFSVRNGIAVDEKAAFAPLSQLSSLAQRGQIPESTPLTSPMLIKLQHDLTLLEQRLASQPFQGFDNPDIQALIRERSLTQQHIAEERQRLTSQLITYTSDYAAVKDLERNLMDSTSKVFLSRGPIYERLYQYDEDIKRESDQYLQIKRRELRFTASGQDDTLHTVLGDAVANSVPVYPQRTPIFIWAFIGSLALAISLAITEELFKRKVRCVKDLSDAVSVPVLAVV